MSLYLVEEHLMFFLLFYSVFLCKKKLTGHPFESPNYQTPHQDSKMKSNNIFLNITELIFFTYFFFLHKVQLRKQMRRRIQLKRVFYPNSILIMKFCIFHTNSTHSPLLCPQLHNHSTIIYFNFTIHMYNLF